MTIALLVLFYLFFPLLILHLCHRFPFVNKLGAVIVAYLAGLLLGNIGLLPEFGKELNEYLINNPQATPQDIEGLYSAGLITSANVLAFKIYKLRDVLMSATILLAIPLLLFSSNVRQWKQLAGKTLASLFLGLIAVVVVIVLGYLIFYTKSSKDLWKVAGMLVGVYTGGTPNLAALKMMLNVDADTYILTHTYDLVVGIFYLAFLMTFGQKIIRWFLPKFPVALDKVGAKNSDGQDPFWGILKRDKFFPLLKAYGVTLAIFAIAGILSMLVPGRLMMVVVILTITTLGILVSLIPSLNRIDKTFESGMYLILIFSLVVSSMADIRNFSGLAPGLFAYITMAVFGSLLLHVLLSRLFKVDADTTMITSVAFICSPPFVPVVAGALGNRHIIVSGITIGLFGYAIGNYLGFLVAQALKVLF
ncbi:MAG TPA: DUF819 family protein [Tenuifilaceae bacterium]|nr:DUF819 family protein [Tenuifilaceae bacterium]